MDIETLLLSHYRLLKSSSAADRARRWHQLVKQAELTLTEFDSDSRQMLTDDLSWLNHPDRFVVSWFDDDYPALLREIADPPLLLFGRGKRDCLQGPKVALVGSRRAVVQDWRMRMI